MERRSSADQCHPLLEEQPSPDRMTKGDKRFRLWYVGWSSLDRRTTLPMLPWLVAEIRRRAERQEPPGFVAPCREVQLMLVAPHLRCVPALNGNTAVFIFEHKAQHIARFIHNTQDPSYFAYFWLVLHRAVPIFLFCGPPQVLLAPPAFRVPPEQAAHHGDTCVGLILSHTVCVF